MTITDIVQRINERMNYESYSYVELWGSLDAAIDNLNINWRINIPMITTTPEMVQGVDPMTGAPISTLVPGEFTNLPDDFIRMYVIPAAASQKYTITDIVATPEAQEAQANLGKLSEKYGSVAGSGTTEITEDNANYGLVIEDTSDQFADGNNNYNLPGQDNYAGPLEDY